MARLTLLHLGDELLVEQTSRLLVQRAVDGDNVALRQHVFQVLDSSASNLLLDLGLEWLIVEVEELLAVERLQATEHALTDTANCDCAHNLVFEIILILCHSSDVPVSSLDLLVGWDEVSNEQENGHDHVLGDGDDVGSGDLGDSDATIGLVCSIQINVIGANASGDSNLELLCFCETLGGQVTGMEAEESVWV